MIIEIIMLILFDRCASLQVDPNISTFARSILSFLNGIHSICPKLPLFSRPPTLFLQGFRFLNHVSILWMWSFSILFNQCSYPVIIMKMVRSFKFIILRSLFFSGGFNSSFWCWSYPFPPFKCFLMPVHLLIIHFSPFICSGVLKISQKTRFFILDPLNLFWGCYLIQAI